MILKINNINQLKLIIPIYLYVLLLNQMQESAQLFFSCFYLFFEQYDLINYYFNMNHAIDYIDDLNCNIIQIRLTFLYLPLCQLPSFNNSNNEQTKLTLDQNHLYFLFSLFKSI
ncbi:hypothetical protein pb186bvf_007535 [Paramecium bursaria]